MTKKKLKNWVIPASYVIIVSILFTILYALGQTLSNNPEATQLDHVTDALLETDDIPVNKELDETVPDTKVMKPYTSQSVKIDKGFYEKDQDEKTQQNALIYYENIYMQNTGVLYSSDEKFEVLAVLDGTIKNIKEDNILGNVIEVEHTPNLTTFYQSVDEVKVKVGDTVKQGDIIASSGKNNIQNTKDNCLHFQVYNKGELLNPETFYNMNLSELI